MSRSLEHEWEQGIELSAFVAEAEANRDMWEALSKRARVPEEALERAEALSPFRLLVLTEDWCGDALNTLPLMDALAREVEGVELRVLVRDEHPELMDAHLTVTSRSIPVVMVLDDQHVERGWWGPRPAPLQSWVLDVGLGLQKEERYRQVRTWYARDRGTTTFRELLDMISGSLA